MMLTWYLLEAGGALPRWLNRRKVLCRRRGRENIRMSTMLTLAPPLGRTAWLFPFFSHASKSLLPPSQKEFFPLSILHKVHCTLVYRLPIVTSMANTTATTIQNPFRFLDLSSELRCMVYEDLVFDSTRHILDRVDSRISKEDWPVHVYDSNVSLIRPQIPPELMMTYLLVYHEARPILGKRLEVHRSQPLRYLVDYSVAWAIISSVTPLTSCIGLPGGVELTRSNDSVRNFFSQCHSCLKLQRSQTGNHGVRVLEMTITHSSESIYGSEVMTMIGWFDQIKPVVPIRLEITCKRPLPKFRLREGLEVTSGSSLEEIVLSDSPHVS